MAVLFKTFAVLVGLLAIGTLPILHAQEAAAEETTAAAAETEAAAEETTAAAEETTAAAEETTAAAAETEAATKAAAATTAAKAEATTAGSTRSIGTAFEVCLVFGYLLNIVIKAI